MIDIKPVGRVDDDAFKFRNAGKYAVRQAGVLVHRAFDSEREATKWATWNYKNRANWTVEYLPLASSSRLTTSKEG